MLKHLVQRNLIRLYHASNRSSSPAVRIANTKLKRSGDLRRHSESPARVSSADPNIRYEPYPFKVTEENQFECLRNKLTPLIDVPYEEQISSKESLCRNALRLLAQQLYKNSTPVRLDVKRLPCHVNKIVKAPLLNKYRNKDEFSIWRGVDGKTPTAGHMIFPVSKHGDTICVSPTISDKSSVIRDETIQIVEIFNEFLKTHAKLSVSYSLGDQGGWRRIAVRLNVEGELMFIGIINPRTLRVREVLEERDNFKEFMVKRSQEEGLKLASLYYQPCPHNVCRNHDIPYELLHGSETIVETIGELKIQLSPDSYLHNSSSGATALYDTVRSTIRECFLIGDLNAEQAPPSPPLILDANCGAGVLSLNLACLAERVIGIDANPQSIDDARKNAEFNGINNVEFFQNSLEILLERILEKHGRQNPNLIVVCDIPSSGLHPHVVHVLRNNREVKKLVLIMPRIGSPYAQDILMGLCSKNLGRSLPPLAPIIATPVDTCPHIESFQTVIAFERQLQ